MKITFGSKILVVSAIVALLSVFNVAKGASFGTPYFVGETVIAINQQNYPTKLFVQPGSGGVITAIRPIGANQPIAYYLAKGNIFYVTGFAAGSMTFQAEETLANKRRILSDPVQVVFYKLNLQTQTACDGYDPTSRSLAVSPVNPLTLLLSITPGNAQPLLHASLDNPSLGDAQILYDSSGRSLLQLVYKASGTTTLRVYDINNVVLENSTIDFLPQKNVSLNLYHVIDSKGERSFRLDQQAMIGYMQTAEKILNQAGVTLSINQQRDVSVPTNLGHTIEAYANGQSPEEIAVLSSAPPQARSSAISVFLVWDYQIKDQDTIGINYVDDTLGQVIFLSEKSHKPGETLAHEIGHALGLEHNMLSSSYLMSPAETSQGDQCLITREERLTINKI